MGFTQNKVISMLAFCEHPKPFAMKYPLEVFVSVHLPIRIAFFETMLHEGWLPDLDEQLDK